MKTALKGLAMFGQLIISYSVVNSHSLIFGKLHLSQTLNSLLKVIHQDLASSSLLFVTTGPGNIPLQSLNTA